MKKLLAIMLSVLLLCSAMPFAAVFAAEEPTIVVSNVEAKAGDEIEVQVQLKNNPGVISAVVELDYDHSVLELVTEMVYDEDMDEDVEMNKIQSATGWSSKYISWGPLGTCLMNFCNGIATKNVTKEDFFTATFKVKENAPAGTYPLTVVYDPSNFFNVEGDTVAFGAVNGSVTIAGDEPVVSEPTIVLPDLNGKAGDEIEVLVQLKNNPGVISAVVEIGYDSSVLELVTEMVYDEDMDEDVEMNKIQAATGWSSKYISWGPLGTCLMNFCNGIATKNVVKEDFFTATFKIKEDAVSGTYPLTVVYDPSNFFNVEGDTVAFAAVNGSITIEGKDPVTPPVECEHEYDADCDPDCNLCGEIRPVHTEGIVHFDAVEPGCHYNGNIEYWMCPKCEIFWADEALTQITNSKNVVLPATGGEVIAFEAIEPGCHMNGQIAYWYCPDCEQYWQDAELTQLTNSKNVILPATGSENLQHVEAVEPTCQSEGNIEYWYCPDCEQYWQDEALTQLTNSKNVKLGVADHSIVHMEAVAPGCHYVGNIEYWFCTECELHWQDAELTQLTNSKNVIIPAVGGDVVAFEAIEPSCHYNGQIAYWYCPDCEQYWQDAELTQLTNSKNVVLPATGSENLQHVEAVEPTCQSEGNIEYWYCPDCEQFWQDEALTQLTNSKNVKLGVADHNIVHVEAVAPGCHYLGNIEYWYCTTCELFWQDEALTQLTNSKNVIIPALGGDVVAFEAIEPSCHYNGQIAYWYCPECVQYWADEALTQLTNSKNVILPATGSENLQHVEAKDPTATEEGNIEYWYCPDCEQYWADEALTQLTNGKNVIVPATGESEKPEDPDSPQTGDSSVAVVVALLTLVASGVAVVLLKDKKRA